MKKSNNRKNDLASKVKELEQLVGDFMTYWGFKKIHGRIWVHLYTSNQALDTIELMKRLKVSKGLMSLAVRELLKYNVIETQTVGRHGSVFYVANPNLLQVITDVLRQRETKMLQQTEDCLTEILKHKKSEFQDSSFELEKFENILRLTQSASSTLQLLLMQQISDKNQTLIQIK
jgi:DNA-binding transcriptional regulator GbsR (MarR family)